MIIFDLKNLKDGPGGIQSDTRALMQVLLQGGRDLGGLIFPVADYPPSYLSKTRLATQSLKLHWARTGSRGAWERLLNGAGRRILKDAEVGTKVASVLRSFRDLTSGPSSEIEKVDPVFARGIFEWLFKPDVDWSDAELFDRVSYFLLDRSWSSLNAAASRSHKSRNSPARVELAPNDTLFLGSPLWLRPSDNRRYFVRWHDAINLLSVGWETAYDAKVFAASVQVAVDGNATFVCNSEVSRRDLLKFFPEAEGRSVVIHCPVPAVLPPEASLVDRVRAKSGLTGEYLVTVSSASPRKNFEGILEIFDELAQHRPDLKLAIIGKPFRMDKELGSALDVLESQGRVCRFLDLSRHTMDALISGAKIYLSGSIHEGFGKGLIEAQALGVPVVAPRTAVFEEIIGDSGMLFDSFNYREATQQCLALLDGGTWESYRAKSRANAARFNFESVLPKLEGVLEHRK